MAYPNVLYGTHASRQDAYFQLDLKGSDAIDVRQIFIKH